MMILILSTKDGSIQTRVSKKLAGHYDVNWIFDQHKYQICRGI